MGRVVLHVGAGKCGSTSLQQTLARDEWRHGGRNGAPFQYLRWRADGSISPVSRVASSSLMGYEYSEFQLTTLVDRSPAQIDSTVRALELASRHRPVVLSNEGWHSEALVLSSDPESVQRCRRLLSSASLDVEAVLYVRPQAAWLESFYLQFGIWSGGTIEAHVRGMRSGREGFWAARVEALQRLGFGSVSVRYVSDVTHDFVGAVLGVAPSHPALQSMPVSNLRVSLDLLLLMLDDPTLRPSMHAPQVEFLVERVAAEWKLPHRPIPPLLGEDVIEQITETYAEDNAVLATMLPPDQAAAFERDRLAFAASRAGAPTVSIEELRQLPRDEAYAHALVAGALDEVMRQRFGTGLPGYGAGSDTEVNGAEATMLHRLRTQRLVLGLLPPGSARAQTVARLVGRFD